MRWLGIGGGAVLGAAVLALGVPGEARADAPALMPAQGVLLDGAGLPVADGAYGVTFALYTVASGGTAVWSETWPPAGQTCATPGACVETQGGAFSVLLGTHTALPPAIFATSPALWLGVKVEADQELPRRRVASGAYALRAASAAAADAAASVTCTGCVPASAMAFPVAAANGSGAALTAVTAGDIGCTGCVTAAEVSFPWAAGVAAGGAAADLDCSGCVSFAALDDDAVAAIQAAYTDQMAVAAVEQAGYMRHTDAVAPAQLPGTGLDEVSGGVLTTQFQSSFVKDGPIAIPDFAPPFPVATATVEVPSIGVAESLSVQVHITHADVGQLVVTLKSPQGVSIVLHDQGGAGTTQIFTVYPSPTLPASGDLGQFVGTDLAGTWTLEVADKAAGGTGSIQSFWMHIGTQSADKAAVNGSLEVSGSLTVGGKAVTGGVPKLECVPVHAIVGPATVSCPSEKLMVFALQSYDNGSNPTILDDCIGQPSCSISAGRSLAASCCSLAP